MTKPTTRSFNPDYAFPPGETLRETLDTMGMTQAELARRTGRPIKTINEIVKGKAAITADTALQLEHVLGVPASFWNNLESQYRENMARISERNRLKNAIEWVQLFPLKAMAKLGWMQEPLDPTNAFPKLLRFFAVASEKAWEDTWQFPQSAYRKSTAFAVNPYALAAWLRQGELIAGTLQCEPYSKRKFHDVLAEARMLTRERDPRVFVPELQKLCATCGVAVVFVPGLEGVPVSGSARWISSERKALIQLSVRHKTDDHLWFTFFHEVGHILLHERRLIFLDNHGASEDDLEEEANRFARDLLIPPNDFKKFKQDGRFSFASVEEFASEIGVAPGIVVGRLQHERLIDWSKLNYLKVRYKWHHQEAQ